MSSALFVNMRDLAAAGHPRADELRAKADEFEEAVSGFYAQPQTVSARSFCGAWARARKLYSECSGKPLV